MPNPHPQASSLIGAITHGPILVSPESEDLLSSYLAELDRDEDFAALWGNFSGSMAARESEDEYWDESNPFAHYRPYSVEDGVLQIPVQGVLLHRFSFQFGRRATGYQYIERAFTRGLTDPEVQAIAFRHDSPGGMVAGNFELVEKITAARGEKPMIAFAEDSSYSASYNLAAAADRLVMTRSGGVGSVGVVVAHMEMSEMLKDWGIKVTFIHAGKHKVDGNPYQKLPAAAKERMQARVDRIYGEFVALVAANRGMDEQAVRDTEALTYDSSEAVGIGFADAVGDYDEEMAAFTAEADNTENRFMTTKPSNTPAAEQEGGQITQAQVDQAKADGVAEGSAAQLTRINAILDSEAGKARPKAALSAALKTSMTADEASAFLAGLPEEKAEEAAPAPKAEEPAAPAPAAAGPTPFQQAMSASGNPEVSAEDDDGEGEQAGTVASILGNFSRASGRKPKTVN